MYNEIIDLDIALGTKPNCVPTRDRHENVELKTELLKQHKAHAAQVRAATQWKEQAGVNVKCWTVLKKNRGAFLLLNVNVLPICINVRWLTMTLLIKLIKS